SPSRGIRTRHLAVVSVHEAPGDSRPRPVLLVFLGRVRVLTVEVLEVEVLEVEILGRRLVQLRPGGLFLFLHDPQDDAWGGVACAAGPRSLNVRKFLSRPRRRSLRSTFPAASLARLRTV